ncbi:class C sortase [Lagierella sp.]|uniref:class C sortase n=1 Tax=Lagierella sp. TaxID=2849657 RepID=UPI00262DDDC5|nr:class C sortase [Lagierella sp.]
MKKKKFKNLPFIFLFLIGFGIMIYPVVSRFYYRIESGKEIEYFEKKARELPDKEVLKRMELARAYNQTLDPSKLADPYTEKEKEGIKAYARMLEIEEKIGHVEIPAIDQDIPVYAGTSESILQKGAGHLEGTSLPIGGASTHTVITAHRGLPTAKLFTDLNRLKEKDQFYIHNIEGVLAYEVDQIKVVEPSDFSEVLVVEGEDYATLLTCTPYMINSHRLLVRGHRIPYNPQILQEGSRTRDNSRFLDYLMFSVPITLVLLGLMIFLKREIKTISKKIEDIEKNEEK